MVPVVPVGETPLARILSHEADYFGTMAAADGRDGWVLFHNRAFPARLDPNHAGLFRAAQGTGASIAREIIAFYRGLGLTPAAYVDALATPSDLESCLIAAGFARVEAAETTDLMLYVGPDRERASSTDAVEDAGTAEARRDWASVMDEDRPPDARRSLAALYELVVGDARVRGYLTRVDGAPAARCALVSSAGLGRVESVFTRQPFRRLGHAAALVRRAVRDSLAAGNALTYLHAIHDGEAQRLYERLGFRTVATDVMRTYVLE